MLIQDAQLNNAAGKDSFRDSLRKKNKFFLGMTVSGIITLAVAFLCSILNVFPIAGHTADLYSGFGCGLIIIGLIKFLQNRRLMNNDTLYKEARLKNQDERNIAISVKAQQMSSLLLLLISYIIMLIAGLFNLLVFWCFWLVIILYTLSYCIFSVYYRRKM